ncbi:MAG: VanW family protein [Limnochordales bacterium]|nr:VanW family protein [Limnochordales bacterium]
MFRRLLSVLAALAALFALAGPLYLVLDISPGSGFGANHVAGLPVVGDPANPQSLKLSEHGKLSAQARAALGLVHLLGRYSTYFNPQLSARVHNLRLAAAAIDGILLQPGQVFSFNEVVGPRTRTAGFLPAPELVGGELVDGVGGGICQLSSTLYNAVLFAMLKVTERVHHSRPLGYVPAGRDATVYDNVLDFRFVNSTPAPVLITAEVVENRLTVELWGSQPVTGQVHIETSAERRLPAPLELVDDPRLPSGTWKLVQRGWDGVEVSVFRSTYSPEGQLLRREELHRDYYQPRAYIVHKGSGVEAEDIIQSLQLTGRAGTLLAMPGAAGLP